MAARKKRAKTIPTLIGLSVITAGLVISVFLVNRSQNLFLQASGDETPTRITISNQAAGELTVTWFTSLPTTGQIQYGSDSGKLDRIAIDRRDSSVDNTNRYCSHYITLTNLEPDAAYYFEIYANAKKFNNSGRPYETITAPLIAKTEMTNPVVYGRVIDKDNQPAVGAIVYLSFTGSNNLSALVDDSGNWALAIDQIRTKNLTASLNPQGQTLEIFVQSIQDTANALASAEGPFPLPNIVLGESFDFRRQTSPSLDEENNPISGFIINEEASSSDYKLSIVNPESEEIIHTQQPLFFGKAPANTEIMIEVQSEPTYTEKITTNNWGDWSWTPPENLKPGEHSITLSFYDKKNIFQTITRSFVVLAAEDNSLPAFTATPSASPSPTATLAPTPTASPTPTPTITQPTTTPAPNPTTTPTPTPTASPTPTPTIIPTLSPTPTSTQTATPSLEPGVIGPTYWILIIGALLIGSGLAISIL